MSSSNMLFLQLRRPDQIEKILKKIKDWSNVILHAGPHKEFKVQSVHHTQQTFELTFTALSPAEGQCCLRFKIDEIICQIDGQLQIKDEEYIFNFKDFSRELKRQLARIEVPEGYSGHFILQEAAGLIVEEETILHDIHTDGFLFSSRKPISIKAGDMLRGHVRLGKFNEVQVGGVIRHCTKRDGQIVAREMTNLAQSVQCV